MQTVSAGVARDLSQKLVFCRLLNDVRKGRDYVQIVEASACLRVAKLATVLSLSFSPRFTQTAMAVRRELTAIICLTPVPRLNIAKLRARTT